MEIGTEWLTFLGTIITVLVGNSLTKYRIEQLEKKVEKYNSVKDRTTVLEEQIKVVNHRIADLEELSHERN